MRDLFIRCFGRVMAILGCSTLVTACYGVPPTPYSVSGHVKDAETGAPVEGILVKVTERHIDGNFDSDPLYHVGTSNWTHTDADGAFSVRFHEYGSADDVIIEWQDVDGPENGHYRSDTMVAYPEDAENLTIEIEREAL